MKARDPSTPSAHAEKLLHGAARQVQTRHTHQTFIVSLSFNFISIAYVRDSKRLQTMERQQQQQRV
jgi:hypothetical protein